MQSNKFGRNYRLEFRIGQWENDRYGFSIANYDELTIQYPLSMQMNINRTLSGTSSSAYLTLFNLSEETATKLWKDGNDTKKAILVRVYAGYGEELPLIFVGFITSCYSYRKGGSTEFITEINIEDCWPLYLFGYSSFTLGQENTLLALIDETVNKVGVFDKGYISPDFANQKLKSKQTFTGNTFQLVKEEFPEYHIYTDLGEIHVVKDNEVTPSDLPYISSSTGLLGTPQRRGNELIIETVFEPRLNVAQALIVETTLFPWISGTYKINAFQHNVIFSPNEAGKAVTTIQCILTGSNNLQLKKEDTAYKGATTARSGFIRPVQGPITSQFDWRIHPITKERKKHNGIDIGCPANSQVKAIANGKITSIGYDSSRGNYVYIDHGKIDNKNITSGYFHLSSFNTVKGGTVSQGQVIALSGSTGASTGPHLHLEIRENGTPINPVLYVGS